jgi:hypothetical protein
VTPVCTWLAGWLGGWLGGGAGNPKGVVLTHQAVVSTIAAAQAFLAQV